MDHSDFCPDPLCGKFRCLENPSLIAGSSVRFELHYDRNGKPRPYNVKILVLIFDSACV